MTSLSSYISLSQSFGLVQAAGLKMPIYAHFIGGYWPK